MNFFVEYFIHPDEKRREEIDEALTFNLCLNFISNIYIFSSEKDFNEMKFKNKKIKNIVTEDRCTFQYIFEFANQVSNKDDINIVANNDIFLSPNFNKLELQKNEFYAISRWEKGSNKPFCYKTCDSQDLWVWKGENKIKECDFYFGILGCDNKIAFFAEKYSYQIKNPAYKYICFHNHSSNIRTSAKNKSLRLPQPYKKVCPCH